MVKRFTKRTYFFATILVVGIFGLVQNILKDNFTKSGSMFHKEKGTLTPDVIQKAYADVPVATATSDGCDGSGDGSNGF